MSLSRALTRVGDRWSLLVVEALLDGPRRFADLQEQLPGIATNVLTQRLRHLEAGRVVVALPYSRRPLRYSYQLSDDGRALAGAIRLLADWSAGSAADPPVHRACGTPMSVTWWCPTCERPADEEPDDAVWI